MTDRGSSSYPFGVGGAPNAPALRMTKAEGCDRLTIPYRHFYPNSHTSTVDHVGMNGLRPIESAAADSYQT